MFEDVDHPHDKAGKTVRRSRFRLNAIPTVVVSLFDGIGGAFVAIDGLSERFNVVQRFSAETNRKAKETTNRYCRKHKLNMVELGNVKNISNAVIQKKIIMDDVCREHEDSVHWEDEKIHFVVVAGPPCQVRET